MGDPRSWFERLCDRLFPVRGLPTPNTSSGWTTESYTVLDWMDRLRILASGKCVVETQTVVLSKSGVLLDVGRWRVGTKSVFSVLPPNFTMPERRAS
mgnify:CR=1 FL=1